MASVFTVFCHGTGMNRNKNRDNEIVNYFGGFDYNRKCYDGYTDNLMLDGVGSDPKDDVNFMAGGFEYDESAPYQKKDISASVKKHLSTATLTGYGVEQNVAFAENVIRNLRPLPKVINMLGWSRGGMTAIRLANHLNRVLPGAKVNLFVVDPVAGTGKGTSAEEKVIPPNVQNYVCVLAAGEKRTTFKPQDLSRIELTRNTNAVILPMPGAHDTVAKLKGTYPERYVGEVTFSMAGQFLRKFGSQIRNRGEDYSNEQYLEIYSILQRYETTINTARTRGRHAKLLSDLLASGGSLKKRSFNKSLELYVVDPDNFINRHHRACFKAVYPQLFTYLYKYNKQKLRMELVEQEYAKLRGSEVEQSLLAKAAEEMPDGEQTSRDAEIPLRPGFFPDDRAKKVRFKGSMKQVGILQGTNLDSSDDS